MYACVAANMAGARLPEETTVRSKAVPRSASRAVNDEPDEPAKTATLWVGDGEDCTEQEAKS